MELTRRDLMRYAGLAAAAMGLSQLQLSRAEDAIAAATTPPVIWLSGSGCTGCSISLLNAVNPSIDQVLTSAISLRYHPNIMAAAGDLAVASARSTAQAGGHILVVEGAIPTGPAAGFCYVWDENGHSVTIADAVLAMAASASTIIAVGSCAAFGGIPKTNSAAQVRSLATHVNKPVINLPGCPTHPSWITATIVQLLAGSPIPLDSFRRPTSIYGRTVHSICPRRETEEASRFGQAGRCLEELGCKGPSTHADCPSRKWNNGRSWCVAVNGLCIGCTEPTFPAFPLHHSESPDAYPQPTPTPEPSVTPTPVPTPADPATYRLALPVIPAGTGSVASGAD